MDRSLSKGEIFARVAALIDRGIHANYRLYPGNYVAADLLAGDARFANQYSAEEKQTFLAYLEKQLARIDLSNRDEAFLREKLLLMYANPVKNHLEAIQTLE